MKVSDKDSLKTVILNKFYNKGMIQEGLSLHFLKKYIIKAKIVNTNNILMWCK